MIKNGNGHAAPFHGVAHDLHTRLSTITANDLITPDKRREPGAEVVGKGSDELKRLYTLRCSITKEYNDIVGDMHTLVGGLNKLPAKPKGALSRLRQFLPATAPAGAVARYEYLRQQAVLKRDFLGIATKMFELQAKREFPSLAEMDYVDMYNDWSVFGEHADEFPELKGTQVLASMSHGPFGLARVSRHRTI